MGWRVDLLKRLVEDEVICLRGGRSGDFAQVGTGDRKYLDVCAPLDHENAVKIIRALLPANPRWRMRPDLPGITPDHPQLKGLKNLYLATDLGQLDVLGELTGVGGFAEAERRSQANNGGRHSMPGAEPGDAH